jgi:hypothetical protein
MSKFRPDVAINTFRPDWLKTMLGQLAVETSLPLESSKAHGAKSRTSPNRCRCLSPIIHRPSLRAVESKNCRGSLIRKKLRITPRDANKPRESSAPADSDPFQPKMICTKKEASSGRKEASSGSLLPVVSMMQAADARQRDQTRRLARLGGNRPHCRCVFLKRVMDPVRVIT